MAERHIANKEATWQAVNTTPDFCKVGTSVVPFDIFRELSNAIIYSPNVYARGVPVLTVTSRIKGVVGDTGSGVASQVSMGAGDVIITSGSFTVNTNKLQTAYNTSDCLMNVGGAPNCLGKVITEQGAPAAEIKNNTPPCNDPPITSPRLEELKKLSAQLKSQDPSELLDFIRTSDAEQIVQGGISEIQVGQTGWMHVSAGVARGILGVANRLVFGLAGLAKMGAQQIISNPVIDAMRHQVDYEILAENIRLGNCVDQRTLWDKIKQAGKESVKPITEPWSKGEYAESITSGGLEAGLLLGPMLAKVGEAATAAEATRAAEAATAAEATRAAEAATAAEATRAAEAAKAAESAKAAETADAARASDAAKALETETPEKSSEASASGGVQGAEDGVQIKPKPYSNPRNRPKYGDGQVEQVWENAKQADGKVYDPNTGEELQWNRTQSRAGQWDMGHVPEQKYEYLHKDYMDGKLDLDEFLRRYRDPANYRPESWRANRSHLYE